MKFFIAVAALTSLAIAAPAAEEVNLNRVAGPVVERAIVEARQTYPGCNNGVHPGDYGCYANIADPNDRFSYLGQCGTDGNTHVSNIAQLLITLYMWRLTDALPYV
jgi:hypothetical protein